MMLILRGEQFKLFPGAHPKVAAQAVRSWHTTPSITKVVLSSMCPALVLVAAIPATPPNALSSKNAKLYALAAAVRATRPTLPEVVV